MFDCCIIHLNEGSVANDCRLGTVVSTLASTAVSAVAAVAEEAHDPVVGLLAVEAVLHLQAVLYLQAVESRRPRRREHSASHLPDGVRSVARSYPEPDSDELSSFRMPMRSIRDAINASVMAEACAGGS